MDWTVRIPYLEEEHHGTPHDRPGNKQEDEKRQRQSREKAALRVANEKQVEVKPRHSEQTSRDGKAYRYHITQTNPVVPL
jgi:hypothetical protein